MLFKINFNFFLGLSIFQRCRCWQRETRSRTKFRNDKVQHSLGERKCGCRRSMVDHSPERPYELTTARQKWNGTESKYAFSPYAITTNFSTFLVRTRYL